VGHIVPGISRAISQLATLSIGLAGYWIHILLFDAWRCRRHLGLVAADMNSTVIRVNDLGFSYPNGPAVLRHIDISIAAGERVGVLGANGAGKSTLLMCLAGVLPIPVGRINVDGLDPAVATDRRQLPARLGVLFQNPEDQLIHATVADDVAFGPLNLGVAKNEIPSRINSALDKVGLAGFEDKSPHRLSWGQKRRAALAGVLAMQPSIILLDEPTSDLDVRGRHELAELLNQMPTTLVIATHDLELVRVVCGRTVVLNAGQIVRFGVETRRGNVAIVASAIYCS
jgi:cobalt/nickel transport system ATP-binding protein